MNVSVSVTGSADYLDQRTRFVRAPFSLFRSNRHRHRHRRYSHSVIQCGPIVCVVIADGMWHSLRAQDPISISAHSQNNAGPPTQNCSSERRSRGKWLVYGLWCISRLNGSILWVSPLCDLTISYLK